MIRGQVHGRYYGTGRRKNAAARVFMKPGGSGSITVNERTLDDYFPRESLRMIIRQPLELVERVESYDITVTVRGGGNAAQAKAVRHGISRALTREDEAMRPPLKAAGLMTRDARQKERKKPGQPGARKKFQYSKR